jgi:hypothetical protein
MADLNLPFIAVLIAATLVLTDLILHRGRH